VDIMAVVPEAQGQGYTSRLMRAVSRAADAEGVPCYLEASSERNTRIYGRFGYEVRGQSTESTEIITVNTLTLEHLKTYHLAP